MMKHTLKKLLSLTLAAAATVCMLGQSPANAAVTPPHALATPDYFGIANYASSPVPFGPIGSISITDSGNGYVSAPAVTITDMYNPLASGATAHATIDASGAVDSIVIDTVGANYQAPVVTIDPPPVADGNVQATADAVLGVPTSGGLHKFIDGLPGICQVNGVTNLGQCMPLAVPDKATFADADFYRIGLSDFSQKMHTDLPPTRLRGYQQLDAAGNPLPIYELDGTTPITFNGNPLPQQYLGPLVIAKRNHPVRFLFENQLPLSTDPQSNLFIPSDITYMGMKDRLGNFTPQNRAVIHLHGGHTPWISDGTPHQWITPAGESPVDVPFGKGDSFQNVPDMVGAGSPIGLTDPNNYDGKATYYYTNQQSGRLLFYHDHALGMTRTNVYAGEAAGYLIVDPTEEDTLAAATAPGAIGKLVDAAAVSNDPAHVIPLIIQDKTYVPLPAQLAATDPTWDTSLYSGYGGLWYPHVYMPNQNPNDDTGANAFGRWDYGPWFFPFQTTLSAASPPTKVTVACTSLGFTGTGDCPITPNPSGTPEGFMDTPVVNGTAYPTLTVDPQAYRFHILSVANDRAYNLSWFVADPTITAGQPGYGTEVKMVSAAPALPKNTPLASVPAGQFKDCNSTTAYSDPAAGNGVALAAINASTHLPLNGSGLPVTAAAPCWPSTWPADGRDGGVPDPTTAGPAWVQIGTESGLLPAPVVIPPTPVNFEYMRRSITVLNISIHGLLLGPAERADVIVDFTPFHGKTLILYNDSPAPVPAFDSRYDYYTGDPDQSGAGGAPTTVPGYGPNTRTVMQVVVRDTAQNPAQTPLDLTTLATAFKTPTGLFATLQNPVLVPEPAYNSVYNNNITTNTYGKIQDNILNYSVNGPTSIGGLNVVTAGTGYMDTATGLTPCPPVVTIAAPSAGTTATAVASVSPVGAITHYTVTNPGSGYSSAPAVTLAPATGCSGSGGVATAIFGGTLMEQKTIQELFTLDYGRMNATLGTELPFTNFVTQTTIPLAYVDPPTEILHDGETQIWKLTHNGVDTHFIHFHLYDVQILNRMGWDGLMKPTEPNELGWKDTVRMNPLEDIVFALRPVKPSLPFPIPDSIRLLDPTMPEDSIGGNFSNLDPYSNAGVITRNTYYNFGQEYVWHCHILGHEENDMMRPQVLMIAPPAPSALNVAWNAPPTSSSVSFQDNSLSETGFTLQSALDADFTNSVRTITVPPKAGYATTVNYTDIAVNPASNNYYRVNAFSPNGTSAWSSTYAITVPIPVAGVSPTSLTFATQIVGTTSASQPVTLSNTGNLALAITSLGMNGGNANNFAQTNNCGASLAAGASCTINVTFKPSATGTRSTNLRLVSNDPVNPTINVSLTGTGQVVAVAPNSLTVPATTNSVGRVTIVSSTSGTPGANYHYEYSVNNGVNWAPINTFPLTSRNPTITLPSPGTYLFRVYVTATGYVQSSYTYGSNPCVYSSVAVAPASLTVPAIANTNGTVTIISATSPTPGANYHYEYSADGGVNWLPINTYPLTSRNPTVKLPGRGTYLFRVYVTATGFSQSNYTYGSNSCLY